jgi:hypothetical protein
MGSEKLYDIYRISSVDPYSRDGEKYDPEQE